MSTVNKICLYHDYLEMYTMNLDVLLIPTVQCKIVPIFKQYWFI